MAEFTAEEDAALDALEEHIHEWAEAYDPEGKADLSWQEAKDIHDAECDDCPRGRPK